MPESRTGEPNIAKKISNIFNPKIRQDFRDLYVYNDQSDLESLHQATILSAKLHKELGQFFATAQAIALFGFYYARRSGS